MLQKSLDLLAHVVIDNRLALDYLLEFVLQIEQTVIANNMAKRIIFWEPPNYLGYH